tara:strand:+ start:959 stop:3379 length:2421 start_codon:yes stop_codon:yes gene_type:complete
MALKDDANDLKGILGEINQTLKDTESNGFGLSKAIKSSQDSMRGLVDAAEEYVSTQTSEKNWYEKKFSLSSKELSSLQEKIKLNKENLQSADSALLKEIALSKTQKDANQNLIKKLKLKSQSKKLSFGEKVTLNEALKINKGISSSLKDQQNQHKLNKKLLDDQDSSLKEIEDTLESAGGPFHDSIKKVGDKINTALKNPLMAGLAVFTAIYKVAMDVDKYIGKMGKDLNIGYAAAEKLNKEFTGYAAKSLDASITQERMAEATTELNTEMGTTHRISNEQLGTMIKMNKYSNISYKDQAKMLKTSKALGETYEGYVNSMMGTIKAQKFNNNLSLNAKKIMLDVNNASDRTKISIAGGSEGLAKAAVEAAKLGTNLDGVAGIADSLLNFEQSIENELKAELLTGKDLNLERARGLALNNDFEGVAREINAQLDSAAEFGEMNRIQQEAMAAAVGMTADQLGNMLIEQEAIKAVGGDLSDAEKAAFETAKEKYGVEEASKKMKEEGGLKALIAEKSLADKQMDAQEKFQAALQGLAAAFLPFFNMLLKVANIIMPAIALAIEPIRLAFQGIAGLLSGNVKDLSTMEIIMGSIGAATLLYMGYMKVIKIHKAAMAGIDQAGLVLEGAKKTGILATIGAYTAQLGVQLGIMSAAMATNAAVTFGIGVAVAVAAAAAGYAAVKALTADDMFSPGQGGGGYGKRTLMGPEGAIQLNNKDTVIAGTNLFGDDINSSPGKPTEMAGKGEIQLKGGSNMAGVVSAVNALGARLDALASRPINVQVGEDVIVKAAVGNSPNITGDEMGKNSYQLN